MDMMRVAYHEAGHGLLTLSVGGVPIRRLIIGLEGGSCLAERHVPDPAARIIIAYAGALAEAFLDGVPGSLSVGTRRDDGDLANVEAAARELGIGSGLSHRYVDHFLTRTRTALWDNPEALHLLAARLHEKRMLFGSDIRDLSWEVGSPLSFARDLHPQPRRAAPTPTVAPVRQPLRSRLADQIDAALDAVSKEMTRRGGRTELLVPR